MSLGESLNVPIHIMYSTPGQPFLVSMVRESPGISCEFVIATMSDSAASESSVPTRLSSQSQPPPVHEQPEMVEDVGGSLGWGEQEGMSPAKGVDDDVYGEQMIMDDGEDEVPPTQQETYHGIFD